MNAKNVNTGNQPEAKFSTGAIAATVWNNNGTSKEGAPTTFRTISLQRAYKDKNGEWQHTNSMRVNDLPKAQLVLQKAFEHIVLRENPIAQSAIVEEQVI